MARESMIEVYRALRESQTRYTYFLLAASGAAIGFAVNETQAAVLHVMHAPLAAAVLCWAGSFYLGCKCVQRASLALYDNSECLKVTSGEHPVSQTDPEAITVLSAHIRNIITAHSNAAGRYATWQFRMLIFGAEWFLAWHVGQMYVRRAVAS
jgi:hypothetical protein